MLPRVDVRWSGLVLEMRYVPSRSTWHALDALLAAERAECPWLVWELRYDRGWPVVRIQADPQDYPALAAIAFVATGGLSGSRNSVMGLDQRFQAADSYWLMRPPRIGRRRILL